MQIILWAMSNKYENPFKIFGVDPIEDNIFQEVITKMMGKKSN